MYRHHVPSCKPEDLLGQEVIETDYHSCLSLVQVVDHGPCWHINFQPPPPISVGMSPDFCQCQILCVIASRAFIEILILILAIFTHR